MSWTLDALAASGFDLDDVTVIGHSQGAIYALYAAALDQRIDRAISNAGFVDTDDDPDPGRWSRPTWYRGFRDLPVGLDYLEVVAAIAPRRALLINYESDDILVATRPTPDRQSAFEDAFPTVDWQSVAGEHAWPTESLDLAIDWAVAESGIKPWADRANG